MRLSGVVRVSIVVCALAYGQESTSLPTFEVASVKPWTPQLVRTPPGTVRDHV
jgi:hypothetical protein